MKKTKINFDNDTLTEFSCSQSGQDIFVLLVLNGKLDGTFLDIGSSDPIFINNTYLLEKKFNWKGVQIEIEEELVNKTKIERNSEVIFSDARLVNYDEIFEKYVNFDYMSLDIDGQPSLEVLQKLPLKNYDIKVITFEHDFYRSKDNVRDESRKIFDSYGYFRICSDVANQNNYYEDWYVHPKHVDMNRIRILQSDKKNWEEIIYI